MWFFMSVYFFVCIVNFAIATMNNKRQSNFFPLNIGLSGVSMVELETFIIVAEMKSFSSAALHMNVTQPTVTNRIHRLENSLDSRVFDRTTRSVSLTSSGESLYVEAKKALRDLSSLIKVFQDKSKLSRQKITFSGPRVLTSFFLEIARNYSEKYPDADVEYCDMTLNEMFCELDCGGVDFCICGFRSLDERFEFEVLCRDEGIFVCPVGHRLFGRDVVDISDLEGERLIFTKSFSKIQAEVYSHALMGGVELGDAKFVNNSDVLSDFLINGSFIGVQSVRESFYDGTNLGRSLFRVGGLDLFYNIGFVKMRRREFSALQYNFLSYLKREISCLW